MMNILLSTIILVCGFNITLGYSADSKINIFFINGNNDEAEKSVINLLNQYNPGFLGQVYTAKVNISDARETTKKICSEWHNSLLNGTRNAPNIIMDATAGGKVSTAVKIITSLLKVPTISTLSGHVQNWDTNKNRSFRLNAPGNILPDILSKIATEFNIGSIAILFDENFSLDQKYRSLFLNILTRHLIIKIDPSDEILISDLKKLRSKSIFNFFVLGNRETLGRVLRVSDDQGMLERKRAWYSISLRGALVYCHHCKSLSVLSFLPQRHSVVGLNSTKLYVLDGFYYKIANLMRSLVEVKFTEPVQLNACEDFDQNQTNLNRSDFRNFLKKYESIPDGFYSGPDGPYKIIMNMKLIKIQDGIITSRQFLGTFKPSRNQSIKVTKNNLIKEHIALAHYRIVTIVDPPFVEYNETTEKFDGFCIDLLKIISAKLNFTYSLYKVQDGKFGIMDEIGRWNGIIRDVMENADIGLAPLSVMAERESVVDFTIPFYDSDGLVILLSKPPEDSRFNFLTVLTDEIWFSLIGMYFAMSFFLWICDKYSPIALQTHDHQSDRRVFTFNESLWFCLTSLTPLGGGELPRNFPGRLIATVWWLVGYIVISSFTAKVAVFFTLTRPESEISSLKDLSKQQRVKYSVVMNSSAYQFFLRMARIEARLRNEWTDMLSHENTTLTSDLAPLLKLHDYPIDRTYSKLFHAMKEIGFLKSQEEGIAKIRNPSSLPFALIEHKANMKYLITKVCDLTIANEEVSKKPYAIAVQQGSPLKHQINNVLLELINKGKLRKMKDKWWPVRKCPDEGTNFKIGLKNIGQVFGLIPIALVLVGVVFFFEYFRSRKSRVEKRKIEKRYRNSTESLNN